MAWWDSNLHYVQQWHQFLESSPQHDRTLRYCYYLLNEISVCICKWTAYEFRILLSSPPTFTTPFSSGPILGARIENRKSAAPDTSPECS